MRYKVELTIDLNENWTGDNPNDWDWQNLLDVGSGMELDEVRIWGVAAEQSLHPEGSSVWREEKDRKVS